jgi:hypothetical protein
LSAGEAIKVSCSRMERFELYLNIVACSALECDIVRNIVGKNLRLILQRLNSSLDAAANCANHESLDLVAAMPALCYPYLQLSLPLVGYTLGDQVESKSLVPVEYRWLACDPIPCPAVPLLVWTQSQECLVDLMIEISAS